MKNTLVLFDIDGTILTSAGAGEYALRMGFEEEFSLHEDLSGIEISGRTDSGIARQVFAKHGLAVSEENLQRFSEDTCAIYSNRSRFVSDVYFPGLSVSWRRLRRDNA